MLQRVADAEMTQNQYATAWTEVVNSEDVRVSKKKTGVLCKQSDHERAA